MLVLLLPVVAVVSYCCHLRVLPDLFKDSDGGGGKSSSVQWGDTTSQVSSSSAWADAFTSSKPAAAGTVASRYWHSIVHVHDVVLYMCFLTLKTYLSFTC